MATSGTFLYSLTADELLDEAWERCGLDPRAIEDAQITSALRSMQLLLIGWSNRGLNLWQVAREQVQVDAGEDVFSPAPGTTDILELVLSDATGTDRMLAPISRDQWMALPQKYDRGAPTMYWSERLRGDPVIHLYPVPDAPTILTYSRIRLPEDLTALTQTLDAPALWFDALCAELAARLAKKFAPAAYADLKAEAMDAFQAAAKENTERVGLTLTPDLG